MQQRVRNSRMQCLELQLDEAKSFGSWANQEISGVITVYSHCFAKTFLEHDMSIPHITSLDASCWFLLRQNQALARAKTAAEVEWSQ